MTLPTDNDSLERALRESPAPVADDGFTGRVLFALPRRAPPSRNRHRILLSAATLGSLVALAAPGDIGLLLGGLADVLQGQPLRPAGLALIVSFAAFCCASIGAALRDY